MLTIKKLFQFHSKEKLRISIELMSDSAFFCVFLSILQLGSGIGCSGGSETVNVRTEEESNVEEKDLVKEEKEDSPVSNIPIGCQLDASDHKVCPNDKSFLSDGDPCERDEECQSRTCYKEGEWKILGGRCTTVNCQSEKDCKSNGSVKTLCIKKVSGKNLCVRQCQTSSDCESYFKCVKNESHMPGACIPKSSEDSQISTSRVDYIKAQMFRHTCLNIEPGKTYGLNYKLKENIKSYFVTVFSVGGNIIRPVILTNSSGIELRSDSKEGVFSNHQYHFTVLQIPASNLYKSFIKPGNLHVGFTSPASAKKGDEVCITVRTKAFIGQNIDLNIYLINVPSKNGRLKAEEAKNNLAVKKAMEHLKKIYKGSGINVRNIKYFDVSDDISNRFSIIRNDADMDKLMLNMPMQYHVNELKDKQGLNSDELLSIDLYLVKSIEYRNAKGLSDTPGTPGIHGGEMSAIVVAAEDLLEHPEFRANTIAHEMGHFLGLHHTSEVGQAVYDPIADTAQCSVEIWKKDQNNCPDKLNVMFPMNTRNRIHFSEEQAAVMKRNPLLK